MIPDARALPAGPVPVTAVVVDIGGVLEIIDPTPTFPRWERAWGLAPGDLLSRLDPVWRDGSLGALTETEVHARIGSILGVDAEQVDALMTDVWAQYLGRLNVPMRDFVQRLRPRYRTAIISNSFVGARQREQAAYGLADLVDVLIYSHEVGLAKPDPRVYRLACERLGVPPEQVVFVDDVPECVDGARAVGMRAVLFRGTRQAIAGVETLLAGA